MKRGVFVVGTDTGVGMTHVASVLALHIDRKFQAAGGSTVGVWKPVETGATGGVQADGVRLVRGSGLPVRESEASTYAFPDAVLPWMAAQRAGERISLSQLAEEGHRRLHAADYTVVDGAGGLAVPLTDACVVADLASALELPLLIVARPGIGTVNHTLLTISYARQAGLTPAGVVLNGFRDGQADVMRENAMMIERFGGVPVLGMLPWIAEAPETERDWADWRERWAEVAAGALDAEPLLDAGRLP
ncbi:dethiobiotin synthase [Paenibacillus sp.]|uniref:dethiobiotin synthase n=1 Tax=Paenibacillus sp. TaxID=58172 RepID=UPI002D4A2735|nr:dethiobiotin synthase [Paenibacillus sp.]HZG55002.1 dethiobiotin synthase [Paenibacillus sp.]